MAECPAESICGLLLERTHALSFSCAMRLPSVPAIPRIRCFRAGSPMVLNLLALYTTINSCSLPRHAKRCGTGPRARTTTATPPSISSRAHATSTCAKATGGSLFPPTVRPGTAAGHPQTSCFSRTARQARLTSACRQTPRCVPFQKCLPKSCLTSPNHA